VAYTKYNDNDDCEFGESQRRGSGRIDCSRVNVG